MSKKVLSVLLILITMLLVTGCSNEVETEPTHSHDFSTTWEFNTSSHYHTCNSEECNEVSELASHAFSEWTTLLEASCESSGAKERVCSVCGYIEQENIPSLGHDFSEWTIKTPATEAADEVQHRICNECDLEETKTLLESGAPISINGNKSLENVDFKQIFDLVEQGVLGELVNIESKDGSIVKIVVE